MNSIQPNGSLFPASPQNTGSRTSPSACKSHLFSAIQTQSHWTFPNPFKFVYQLIAKIFTILTFPFYILFAKEEKERWLNELPAPIHYNAFNGGSLTHIAKQARFHMKSLLEALGAKNISTTLANNSLPGWSNINTLTLPNQTQYNCGPFSLTGKEIKNQASSLRVSYDPSILSPLKLSQILTKGAGSAKEEALARGRMVSSLAASVCDSQGNPLPKETPLPLYRVYTSNAPNLAYSSYDKKEFLHPNGAINKEKYAKELERIFSHYFEEAKNNNDKLVILCGFGMGAFMPSELLPEGQKCFVQALQKAVNKYHTHFDKIVFGDPNGKLTSALTGIDHLTISNKSCLDIAHYAAKGGHKVALFNPGDGSGIPGQFWLNGHIALEEMFGLFTTLLLSQHPHCNPQVGNKALYQPSGI